LIFFDSLSSTEASHWLHASEIALIVFSLLLVFGLVGEWPESESWKSRWLYNVAKACVIIGVAGELLADGGIFGSSSRLQSLQEADIARVNSVTEGLRSDNLALEKQIQPRRLTREQQVAIGRALASFAGKRVRVESYFLDSEAAILGKEIVYALFLAGIDLDDAIMNVTSTTGSFLFAVHVYGEDEKLTTTLLTVLGKAELLTSPDPPKGGWTGFATAHPEIIPAAIVFVGAKPITQ
jgi:hypothetical protein